MKACLCALGRQQSNLSRAWLCSSGYVDRGHAHELLDTTQDGVSDLLDSGKVDFWRCSGACEGTLGDGGLDVEFMLTGCVVRSKTFARQDMVAHCS